MLFNRSSLHRVFSAALYYVVYIHDDIIVEFVNYGVVLKAELLKNYATWRLVNLYTEGHHIFLQEYIVKSDGLILLKIPLNF